MNNEPKNKPKTNPILSAVARMAKADSDVMTVVLPKKMAVVVSVEQAY